MFHMNPSFTWITLGHTQPKKVSCCSSKQLSDKSNVIDIMGALIQSPQDFDMWLHSHMNYQTTISLGGELKSKSQGRPPSNFRYTKDPILNHNVVSNVYHLICQTKQYSIQNPIFITSIPRELRQLTFQISPTGYINTSSNHGFTNDDGVDVGVDVGVAVEQSISKKLHLFLESFGIHNQQLIKLRESCRGSKYRTYLIDMISFLYQVESGSSEFRSYFQKEYRRPVIHNGSAGSGESAELSQLFMETVHNTDSGGLSFQFWVPKPSSVSVMYTYWIRSITLEDNFVKENIRSYVNTHRVYRWTDFDVNDIDDALTLLMITHAYRVKEGSLTGVEREISKQLEDQLNPWFSQLR